MIGGWLPGEGKRGASASARCSSACTTTTARCATSAASAPASPRPSWSGWPSCCAPLERDDSPFAPGGPKIPREAVFAEPELVAEVEFREWTDGGQLRAPSYKGLRDDKPLGARRARGAPTRSVRRASAGASCKLSNLDKVLYPDVGFTKRDVIDYYARIAPGRAAAPPGPGADAQALPQRRRGAVLLREARAVAPARLGRDGARRATIDYSLAEDEPTLVVAGQPRRPRAAHVAGAGRRARAPDARRLRPRPGRAGDRRRVLPRGASCCAACSRASACECFAKTSGSKGMQVYLPLNSEATFAQTKAFAKAVAELLEREEPGLVVSRQTKSRARGQGARRLEPERRQQDDGQRLLAARDAAPDGVDAGHVGRGPRGAGEPEDLTFDAARGAAPRRRARRPVRAGAVACPAPPRGVAFAAWTSCGGSSPRSASRPRSARPTAPSAASSSCATPSARPGAHLGEPEEAAIEAARRRWSTLPPPVSRP